MAIRFLVLYHRFHQILKLTIEFSPVLNSLNILSLRDQFGLLLNQNHHLVANFSHHIVHKPIGCILKLRVGIKNLDIAGRILVDVLEKVITTLDVETYMPICCFRDGLTKVQSLWIIRSRFHNRENSLILPVY